MMDIPCRIMRQNHTVSMPVSVVYLDTETEATIEEGHQVHRMKLGWTVRVEYDTAGRVRRQKWAEFRSGEAMCRWIATRVYEGTALWVFAHNVFFDLQVSGFFAYFTKEGWELQFIYEQGLTYILVIRKEKKTIKCVSTTNFFQCNLKTLGEMVGLEKMEVDFGTVDPETLSIYCHRDVEIIKKAMEHYFAFIRRNDLGAFSMTIPSQAMRAFRHRYMQNKIYLHQHPQVQRLEQDSYFGGRTECFQLGRIHAGPVVTLDVNSMYPHVMASQSVPTQLVDYLDQPDPHWLRDALRGLCVVSRVVLETDQPIYPVRHNKRVCFPIGRFETVLCTAGLREALKRGHLVSLGETAAYRKAVLFRSYVRDLYRLRMVHKKRGEEVWTYLCKILLNSLYGKWAQRRPILEEESVPEPDGYRREEVLDLVTGRKFIEYQLFNRRITQQGDEPAASSLIAISAHITEAARMLLWRLIERAGRENVLYCDTDSLKLRERHVDRLNGLLHPTRLGRLKIEKVSERVTIWGLKAYSEDGQWKIKGIPRSAKASKGNTYTYQHFLKQASHMRCQQISGMIIETAERRLKLEYQKGVVTQSGRVEPFVFGPLDPDAERPSGPQRYGPIAQPQ